MNRQRGKPHREITAGDEIVITRPLGRKQRVIVRGLAERHLPKADARGLYADETPPPSPEEVELLRLTRLANRPGKLGKSRRAAPGRRERRALRRLKGFDE